MMRVESRVSAKRVGVIGSKRGGSGTVVVGGSVGGGSVGGPAGQRRVGEPHPARAGGVDPLAVGGAGVGGIGVGGAGVWVALSSGTEILDCTFVGNDAGNSPFVSSGAVYVEDGGDVRIERCLFYDNNSSTGPSALAVVFGSTAQVYSSTIVANLSSGVLVSADSNAIIESTILAFNTGAAVQCLQPGGSASFTCCDVFGNGDNWTGCLAGQLGQSGNIAVDPLFCDEIDWRLSASSPCAPANSGCGLIGAFDVACGPVPAHTVTWGRIKARFP